MNLYIERAYHVLNKVYPEWSTQSCTIKLIDFKDKGNNSLGSLDKKKNQEIYKVKNIRLE